MCRMIANTSRVNAYKERKLSFIQSLCFFFPSQNLVYIHIRAEKSDLSYAELGGERKRRLPSRRGLRKRKRNPTLIVLLAIHKKGNFCFTADKRGPPIVTHHGHSQLAPLMYSSIVHF